jgi:hypothetical protein
MSNHVIEPGDAILARTKGFYGAMIRFGQRLRWKNTKTNHVALVVGFDAHGEPLCAQMAKRGQIVRVRDIAPGGKLYLIKAPTGIDRQRAVDFGKRCEGIKYGVLTIICIAINILSPRPFRIDFREDDTLICSALVARAWEHGGWLCPTDPFQITPAELEVQFGDTGWPVNYV